MIAADGVDRSRTGPIAKAGGTFGRSATLNTMADYHTLSQPHHFLPQLSPTVSHIKIANMSSKSSTPPQPQWVKDLISPPAPRTTPNWPTPPGYRDSAPHSSLKQRSKASTRKAPTQEEMDTLKMKKAWELAIAPAKQLPMNAFGALRPLRLLRKLNITDILIQACT